MCRSEGNSGVWKAARDNRRRQLAVDLRVGDYAMDNTRQVRGDFNFPRFGSAAVPIDNDPDAIRAVLWYNTDAQYKRAVEQLTKVKTNVKVKVAQEDSNPPIFRGKSRSGLPSPSPISMWTVAPGKKSCASTRRHSPGTPTSIRQPPFCKRPSNPAGIVNSGREASYRPRSRLSACL